MNYRAGRHAGCACCVVLALASPATMRAQTDPEVLAPFQFLLGEWTAMGDQGNATGGFTFTPSVQRHVIVRTNYSDTPASNGKPASRHDDLMVIYFDGDLVQADYY